MIRRRSIYFIIFLLTTSLLIHGCDTGGDGGGGGGDAGGGGKTIDFSGGNGIAGNGGNGGFVYMGSFSDIEIKSSGVAEAGFGLPAAINLPSYMACSSEFRPNATVTVNAFSDDDPLGAAGGYYLIYGSPDLKQDSDMNGIANLTDMTVGCVNVPQGVTVTLALNFDGNDADLDGLHSTGADYSSVVLLDGDLRVAGVLKAALLGSATASDATNGLDSGSLQLSANDIFVPGTISAAGLDNTAGRGGHGGRLYVEASMGPGGTLNSTGTLDCSGGDGDSASDGGIGCASADNLGVFSPDSLYTAADQYNINRGTMHAHGGNGRNGGDAGNVQLDAESHLYHAGTIHAVGGNGSSTAAGSTGGSGQGIVLYSYTGSVNISGTIDGSGGTGADGGGNGAGIILSSGASGISGTGYAAPVNVSGAVTVNGGDALVDGNGGDGGSVLIYSYGGDIRVSGNLSGAGGSAAGTSTSGGSGDFMEFVVDSSGEAAWGNSLIAGGITVSGNLNVSGGDGDFGGEGGYMQAYHVDTPEYVLPEANPIRFLGYSRVDGHGGTATSGGADGGTADNIYLETLNPFSNGSYLLAGHVENNARIDLSGGDGDTAGGSGGTGGSGGFVEMYANSATVDTVYDVSSNINYVLNTGNIDLSGGIGDAGGPSTTVTYLQLYGYNEVKNTGTVNLSGGDGTTNGGGSDAWIYFASSQNVINSGRITANGGTGSDGNGGDAALAYLGMYAGGQTRNSGALLARGGNGNTASGNGGNGGEIDLWSQQRATSNTASLSVAGGIANTSGSNGTIFIDGGNITPADGTL